MFVRKGFMQAWGIFWKQKTSPEGPFKGIAQQWPDGIVKGPWPLTGGRGRAPAKKHTHCDFFLAKAF